MSLELNIGSRINHPTHGEGVVCAVRYNNYKVSFIKSGVQHIDKDEEFTIIEHVLESDLVSIQDLKLMMKELLDKSGAISEVVPIADKWKKGTLKMIPFDDALQAKEVPIDAFFHKIVMLRDRLRVMEQKINAHPVLDDAEKVEMQQYITRCYGSLTTFNILFRNKEQQFVGQKGD